MISSIREKRAEVVEVDSAIPIEKDSAPAPKGQIFKNWLFRIVGIYQKEDYDFWHFLNAPKLQKFIRKTITYLAHRIQQSIPKLNLNFLKCFDQQSGQIKQFVKIQDS